MPLSNLIPPQYKMIAYVVAVAGIFYTGWSVNGWRLGEEMAKWQADVATAQTKASENAREKERLSGEVSKLTGDLYQAQKATAEATGRVITKEVIKYVQAPYAGKCDIPNGFVRLDTAATRGVSPDAITIAGADDASSGLTDADAIAVITERSQICRNEINKLKALQTYVKRQLELQVR